MNILTDNEIEIMANEIDSINPFFWRILDMYFNLSINEILPFSPSKMATLVTLKELRKRNVSLEYYKYVMDSNLIKGILSKPIHREKLENFIAKEMLEDWKSEIPVVSNDNMGSLTLEEINQMTDEIFYYNFTSWIPLSEQLGGAGFKKYLSDLNMPCTPAMGIVGLLKFLRLEEVPFKYYKYAVANIPFGPGCQFAPWSWSDYKEGLLSLPLHKAKLEHIEAEEIPKN